MADPATPAEDWTKGQRFGFTVITRRPGCAEDIRFDADSIESAFRDGDMEPMLSFISSGRRMQVPAIEVVEITLSNPRKLTDGYSGTGHCAHCDGPLNHMMKVSV